jgi:hypothetical protein
MSLNPGGGTSQQVLMLLVVVAVFAGIVFGLWLFGSMT